MNDLIELKESLLYLIDLYLCEWSNHPELHKEYMNRINSGGLDELLTIERTLDDWLDY